MAGEPTGTMIYEGKAKKIFTTDRPDQVLQYFKDDYIALLPPEEQGRLGRSLRLEPVGAAS